MVAVWLFNLYLLGEVPLDVTHLCGVYRPNPFPLVLSREAVGSIFRVIGMTQLGILTHYLPV